MSTAKILVYGATGYTGRLVVEELARRARDMGGAEVMLGGRDAGALDDLAREHGLEFQAFPLDEEARNEVIKKRRKARLRATPDSKSAPESPVPTYAIDSAIADHQVVVNVAGPFGATAKPLAQACVRQQVHYVDVSGEQRTFRDLASLEESARKAGVMLVTGAAFSVFAAEELVAWAAEKIARLSHGSEENAVHTVRVALSRVDHLSRGSVQTMLGSVREGIAVRRNGVVAAMPIGELDRMFDFRAQDAKDADRRRCMAMSLAEVEAIWRSVKAPNVEAYVEATTLESWLCEAASQVAIPLQMQPWKEISRRWLGLWPNGPGREERDVSSQIVVAEVEDRYQRCVRGRLETDNSYDFTVRVVAEIAQALVSSDAPLVGGLFTPQQACRHIDKRDVDRKIADRILGKRGPQLVVPAQ